ncbi:RNA polymerase sigma factor [Parvularcula lutaonensis]|uniref:RNA polymerase sigma factor n=1 Tax=Parvularcula lutaonensis TaxID=491923 RepID=A0ABV7MFX4_9PROT
MDLALNEAAKELERQARRHMEKVRREYHWQQTRRRQRMEALRQPPADVQAQERRQLFFDLIEQHLDRVWTYAWRELRYLEASGSIPAGALSVEDAIDAILAEGAKRFEERPTEFSVDEWLLKLTVETLEAEARRVARTLPADALSLEDEVPEPATDPTTADEEFYEFYQPDDAPRLEDVVPYPQAHSPEAELEEREEALAVHRALSQLPQRWRHALVLSFIEDMPRDRVASMLGVTEKELGEMIDRALTVLRAKLLDDQVDSEALSDGRVADHLRNTRRIVVHQAMRLRLARALGIEAPVSTNAD